MRRRRTFSDRDVPTDQDYKTLDRTGGDAAYEDFIRNYGYEALDQRYGRDPSYVPTPRPRLPEEGEPNPFGYDQLTKDELVRRGADLRPQDVDRLTSDRDTWRRDVQRNTGSYPSEEEASRNGVGYTDEELLELVQRGLAQPRR